MQTLDTISRIYQEGWQIRADGEREREREREKERERERESVCVCVKGICNISTASWWWRWWGFSWYRVLLDDWKHTFDVANSWRSIFSFHIHLQCPIVKILSFIVECQLPSSIILTCLGVGRITHCFWRCFMTMGQNHVAFIRINFVISGFRDKEANYCAFWGMEQKELGSS